MAWESSFGNLHGAGLEPTAYRNPVVTVAALRYVAGLRQSGMSTSPRTVISSLPSTAPDGLRARYRRLLLDAWDREEIRVTPDREPIVAVQVQPPGQEAGAEPRRTGARA